MADVIIVGGGVAGLSAAIYTANAGLNTVIFDRGKSQLKQVSTIYNYPGFPEGIPGKTLIEKMRKQAIDQQALLLDEKVEEIEQNGPDFTVSTENDHYSAKYIVLASNLFHGHVKALGFDLEVNTLVPSGKIKSVKEIGFEGETSIPNLYVAGLHTNIPSQAVVAAGQGAHVGIKIASRELAKAYMWHDK